jgi:hypothetical protein
MVPTISVLIIVPVTLMMETGHNYGTVMIINLTKCSGWIVKIGSSTPRPGSVLTLPGFQQVQALKFTNGLVTIMIIRSGTMMTRTNSGRDMPRICVLIMIEVTMALN